MGKEPEQTFLHRQHMGIYNKDARPHQSSEGMQIKFTRSYHLPERLLIRNSKCWQGCGEK